MILSLLCVEAGALAAPIWPANETATQAVPTRRHRQRTQRSNDTALFVFAVMSDTHVWLPSAARDEYQRGSDGASERDGLLVDSSLTLLRQQLQTLQEFAATGGSFAIHCGDAVCGGGSFTKVAGEYESSLEAVVAEQRSALGSWPVFYASGNHDVDPTEGGLAKWRRLLGGSGMGEAASGAAVGYRAVRVAPGWQHSTTHPLQHTLYNTPALCWVHSVQHPSTTPSTPPGRLAAAAARWHGRRG